MKICHLIDHMGIGGAQSMVVDLAELHGTDIEPTVVSLRNSILPQFRTRLDAANVTYHSLSFTRLSLLAPWQLRRFLANGRFDLLHAHLDYSNSVGVLAALSLPAPRPAIVSHIHANPFLQNSAVFRAVARRLAPHIDNHVVASASLAKETESALQMRARRIDTIDLGIDISRFRKSPGHDAPADSLRGGARCVISFIGRLAPQKNIATLLRAMPEVLRAQPSTRLLIAGDGPERSALGDLCEALGIASAVTFLGYVADVRSVYEASDVFVLPSWHEGFGIVLAEAMAMEVPIVTTQTSGIVDVVEDGRTALLIPPGDASGFATAILRLFDDQSLRHGLVSAARHKAQDKFSRENMARRMDALYKDILAR